MNLSAHFTLEELTRSDYAFRHGIDNTPTADVFENLGVLAAGLERVRAILSLPIHVTSGYRCPKLNSAIGGSRTSKHMEGLAADLVCYDYGTPLQIAEAVEAEVETVDFDQLIMEGEWVHIGFADNPRHEVLTAHFENGAATYTRGL